ncbi:hypothetical protein ASPBRDRAFT_47794 [Aspergillus brasiliensis CBS 101740]|uniref:Uncharacterized protein n=1 Tax=Aspergillus brasiliensis (strain CBS 101740 / IMI 381727 / IBT 21946) TaxID=767769 RepID=A0A1L9U7W5_ASPBC|nr:hypothetical protein ASPBRDRAFT_47794 [Aspergillus brasiliensis CBS 101740]
MFYLDNQVAPLVSISSQLIVQWAPSASGSHKYTQPARPVANTYPEGMDLPIL